MIVFLIATAMAAPTVGVELGGHTDLSDATTASTSMAGGSFALPVGFAVGERSRVFLAPHVDFGGGKDQVSWTSGQAINGEPFRYTSDTHKANLFAVGLMARTEMDLSTSGSTRPWLGAGIGAVSVSHHHSFGGEESFDTIPLLPGEDGTGDENPRTQQWALLSELRGGVRTEISDELALGAHIGYSTAFLGASNLLDTADELDARRDAYGWNAFRFGLAVHIAL